MTVQFFSNNSASHWYPVSREKLTQLRAQQPAADTASTGTRARVSDRAKLLGTFGGETALMAAGAVIGTGRGKAQSPVDPGKRVYCAQELGVVGGLSHASTEGARLAIVLVGAAAGTLAGAACGLAACTLKLAQTRLPVFIGLPALAAAVGLGAVAVPSVPMLAVVGLASTAVWMSKRLPAANVRGTMSVSAESVLDAVTDKPEALCRSVLKNTEKLRQKGVEKLQQAHSAVRNFASLPVAATV
jgi:hypothetical protein